MATPTWVTLANSNQYNQVNSGTPISSFTTVTDISPGLGSAGQAFQTSPSQLYPGQLWRFTANGIWSSTSSPGISLGVYYGGAAGSPLCYGSVPTGSAFTNCASIPWYLTSIGKVTAVGPSTASWQVIGALMGIMPITPGATGAVGAPSAALTMAPYTSAAQYDTASAHTITVAAQCTTSAGANAVTCYNWAVEYMTES